MRNLGRGLVLITLVLSCAACGESPTALTAFRDRGAGTDPLPQRYRRLARPAERALLLKGARVIWSLECRPLRLSCRSRRRGYARNAKQTVIRLLMVSATI